MASCLPIKGFLGADAPFGADFNLVVQIIMAAALCAGAFLAKRRRFKAHGICQTTVLLLNLLMIALVMGPAFKQRVAPRLPRSLHRWYYAVAALHASLGITAEVLGLYIILVTSTDILPAWLRFSRWKVWMRTELALWFVVLIIGIGTYYAWYIAPFR